MHLLRPWRVTDDSIQRLQQSMKVKYMLNTTLLAKTPCFSSSCVPLLDRH